MDFYSLIFWGGTGWKISAKWQELPTCAIYFSPWPSGLLRPGNTSGKNQSFQMCLYTIDIDHLNCFRKWKVWRSQKQVMYIHIISNILYILYSIYIYLYYIMHWQTEIQGISQKVSFGILHSNQESKTSDWVHHLAWIFEYLKSDLESESSDQFQHGAWIFQYLKKIESESSDKV